MDQELQKCADLFINHEGYFQLGVYGAFFVTTLVFAFMKKSIPSFVKDIMSSVVNAVGKKKPEA